MQNEGYKHGADEIFLLIMKSIIFLCFCRSSSCNIVRNIDSDGSVVKSLQLNGTVHAHFSFAFIDSANGPVKAI